MSVLVEADPQVNKFEEVSSDDHQVSLVGGGYVQRGWVCPEGRYVHGGWVCPEGRGVGMSRCM